MTNTPTDAEIDAVTLEVLGYAALDKETNETARDIARAVLAKWGTPAPVVVGEVAEHYRNAIASACEGWTMPDGLRKHLETALWSQPTPQPIQAQAGAVPLTNEHIRAMLNKHPPEEVCDWSYRLGIDDAELHHGIKGGQHGAE